MKEYPKATNNGLSNTEKTSRSKILKALFTQRCNRKIRQNKNMQKVEKPKHFKTKMIPENLQGKGKAVGLENE